MHLCMCKGCSHNHVIFTRKEQLADMIEMKRGSTGGGKSDALLDPETSYVEKSSSRKSLYKQANSNFKEHKAHQIWLKNIESKNACRHSTTSIWRSHCQDESKPLHKCGRCWRKTQSCWTTSIWTVTLILSCDYQSQQDLQVSTTVRVCHNDEFRKLLCLTSINHLLFNSWVYSHILHMNSHLFGERIAGSSSAWLAFCSSGSVVWWGMPVTKCRSLLRESNSS